MKIKVVDTSGFGGFFKNPIIAGLKYLKENPDCIIDYEFEKSPLVPPVPIPKNEKTKELFEFISKAEIDTTAEYYISINHVYLIWKHGYEEWIRESEKRNIRTFEIDVDKEIYDLFHSFKGVKDV